MSFGETVTRIRRQKVGEDRNNAPIWDDVESAIPGAGPAPSSTDEPVVVDGRPSVADLSLYFYESFPDIVRDDRIRVRGQVYQVLGDPAEWVNPFTGWRAGTVVNLRRGEGS